MALTHPGTLTFVIQVLGGLINYSCSAKVLIGVVKHRDSSQPVFLSLTSLLPLPCAMTEQS